MLGNVGPFNISSTYAVLGDDGNAIPVNVSERFFEELEQRFGDFQGRTLVSLFTFDKDWDTWEIHPAGDELVCLLSGQIDLVLEQDEGEHVVPLREPGMYALVPRGTWHTARVHIPSSVLFITPGKGTQNRSI